MFTQTQTPGSSKRTPVNDSFNLNESFETTTKKLKPANALQRVDSSSTTPQTSIPMSIRHIVTVYEVDSQLTGLCWAVAKKHDYFVCWDSQSVGKLLLPPSDWTILVAPSGSLKLGVNGRRWIAVTREGMGYLYASNGNVDDEIEIGFGDDGPWRLCSGISINETVYNYCWGLTTRDGRFFEIAFDMENSRLSSRHVCGTAKKESQWGSWLTSLWSAGDNGRRFLAACCIPGELWLLCDEMGTLHAYRMLGEEEESSVWISDALEGEGNVVDMLFYFRTNLLFVLREQDTYASVYTFVPNESPYFALIKQVNVSARADINSKLYLSEDGTVGVVGDVSSMEYKPNNKTAMNKSLNTTISNNSNSNNNNTNNTTIVSEEYDYAALPIEKVEQISNELCGSFANDYWLVWAEKMNDVALEKVGQILRSRVAKHRALLIANPQNKLLIENNGYICATQGFFVGWNEMMRSIQPDDAEDYIDKDDISNVIASTIGVKGTRRLSARNLKIFTMLWACCPVITHVLSLFKNYSTNDYPYRTRSWAFKITTSATLQLINCKSYSLIKADIILAFLSMDNLPSYGMEREVLAKLAMAAVLGTDQKPLKLKAFQFLEMYGTHDQYRALCEEQGLCLVSLVTRDFGKNENRATFYNYLQRFGAAFELEFWKTLIHIDQDLGVALSIANDDGVISQSLFKYLESNPHPIFSIHSIQSRKYDWAAASLLKQCEKEDSVLPRKKTLASLSFLSARCAFDTSQIDREIELQLKVCRVASLVGISQNLTHEQVFNYLLNKLDSTEQTKNSQYLFAGAALELHRTEEELNKVIVASYKKDQWEERMEESFAEAVQWIPETVLGKVILSNPRAVPSHLFVNALKGAFGEEHMVKYQEIYNAIASLKSEK